MCLRQIIERLAPRSPLELCLLPPVFLDDYVNDSGGDDVPRLAYCCYPCGQEGWEAEPSSPKESRVPAQLLPDDADLEVAEAQPGDAEGWDRFVDQHSEGRFCHLWGFRRALQEGYAYRCVYVNILARGHRVGIFPSIVLHRGLGKLVSQPFNEYGGPLTENFSPPLYSKLAALLLRVAHQERCRSVEIRGGIGLEAATRAGWSRTPVHSYATLPLAGPDHLWRHALTGEARKGVNRALHAGLRAEIRRGAAAVADEFYPLYLLSMKRLGVPPHRREFFLQLAAGLGNRLVAAWVQQSQKVAAILLAGIAGKRIHIFVTASETGTWSLRPNDLAHWELIRWAHSAALETLDFGSARYAGQIQFKKKWGAAFQEYCIYRIGPPDNSAPLHMGITASSSRLMRLMSNAWRHTVPLSWTEILGPPIRKYLTR